jgi:hypothetical protein
VVGRGAGEAGLGVGATAGGTISISMDPISILGGGAATICVPGIGSGRLSRIVLVRVSIDCCRSRVSVGGGPAGRADGDDAVTSRESSSGSVAVRGANAASGRRQRGSAGALSRSIGVGARTASCGLEMRGSFTSAVAAPGADCSADACGSPRGNARGSPRRNGWCAGARGSGLPSGGPDARGSPRRNGWCAGARRIGLPSGSPTILRK